MKEITQYQAKDGKVFSDPETCIEYESLLIQAEKAMEQIPPDQSYKKLDFRNGDGYIQHHPAVFRKFKLDILRLIQTFTGHHVIDTAIEKINTNKVHSSWVTRIASDYDFYTAVSLAWYRVCCTDDQFREWEQPYYAMKTHTPSNPICMNEAKEVSNG